MFSEVMLFPGLTVHARTASCVRLAVVLLVLLFCAEWSRSAVVSVQDKGAGLDYMSGDPITLPAAQLCTNLFRNGAQVIRNRTHRACPAVFDSMGRLSHRPGEPASVLGKTRAKGSGRNKKPPVPAEEAERDHQGSHGASGFPTYLEGQQYVWFRQDLRHYTNYSCTVTVDCPSTFYLLVDNRVNDFARGSEYDDPTFGPPDTQWVLDDGWKRVNTGLTPVVTPTCVGDYVGIDEGNNGTINQVYAVYAKTLSKPGAISLGTEFDGNIYCLVVSTNLLMTAKAGKKPRGVSPPKPPAGK